MTAAQGLGLLANKGAVQALCDALRDAEWSVRYHAALSLGEIGDSVAVIPLIKALGDARENVRRGVVESLGRLGDKRAVPALERQRKVDEHLVTSMIDTVLPSLRRGRKAVLKPEQRLLPPAQINRQTIKPLAAIQAARQQGAQNLAHAPTEG